MAEVYAIKMWLCVVAVFCDYLLADNPVTTQSNSSAIPRTADGYPYMTDAVYRCRDGRKFDDGTTVRTLFCIGNGYWSYPSVECACTFYQPRLCYY